MQSYAGSLAPRGEHTVSLDVRGFELSYLELFRGAATCDHDIYTAFSADNFKNPVCVSDEQRLNDIGPWGEIFPDKVMQTGAETRDGKLPMLYTANANRPGEKRIRVLAPRKGWCMMTPNGLLVPGTTIPFLTIDGREKAILNNLKYGIPPEYAIFFFRMSKYDSEKFVGRDVSPDCDGSWFDIVASRSPDDGGRENIGARFA